ncbi:MAG TPA: GNAT family N-acetyltransferase [Acidimicrobiia bacterium]|nr:GNAT family N-acetyltransferase [Acidimicrobiia bacterium]
MTEIRPLREDELEDFLRAMSGPFGFDLPDEEADRTALLTRFKKIFEPDRARCAFEDGRMVGTLGVFSFTMTVPGGSIPTAGTTQVTTQVTHRRQGILTAMMRAHLSEAVSHGDAAAALWASDSAIYGRFGFGMASWSTEVVIDRRHVDLHRLAATPAPVEILDADSIRASAIENYDAIRVNTPGMMSKSEGWWDRILSDPSWAREGATKARYGLAVEDGRPVGWVRYRLKDAESDDHHPSQDVRVSQLYAQTPGAWAGLWNHVMSHDFGRTIRADLRPLDDPIHALLKATRRAKTRITDGLWVRILDVARTLDSRTYRTDGTITFGVHDPLEFASGRYRLSVEDGTGTITAADDAAVELDVEDLGALSLGGRSAIELAMAGRVTGAPDEIEAFDTLLRGSRAPWTPLIF